MNKKEKQMITELKELALKLKKERIKERIKTCKLLINLNNNLVTFQEHYRDIVNNVIYRGDLDRFFNKINTEIFLFQESNQKLFKDFEKKEMK